MSVIIKGKWISVSPSDMPVGEAAATILAARLHAILNRLPLAALSWQEDRKHVHRLRVSCRRADAALRAFGPLLSGKNKRVQKKVKQIRQAAGAARDLDVLLLRLQSQPQGHVEFEHSQFEHGEFEQRVLELLHHQRTAAQQPLRQVFRKQQRGGFDRAIGKLLAELDANQSKGKASFQKFAKRAVKKSRREFQQLADVSQPTIDVLHDLRIAGKRLRYAIELFHSVLEPTVRQQEYPHLVDLQRQLGDLNDHAAAQQWFQRQLAEQPADEFAAYLAQGVIDHHCKAQSCYESVLESFAKTQ